MIARFRMLSPQCGRQGFPGRNVLLPERLGLVFKVSEHCATKSLSEDAGRFCGDRQNRWWRVTQLGHQNGAGPVLNTHSARSRQGNGIVGILYGKPPKTRSPYCGISRCDGHTLSASCCRPWMHTSSSIVLWRQDLSTHSYPTIQQDPRPGFRPQQKEHLTLRCKGH